MSDEKASFPPVSQISNHSGYNPRNGTGGDGGPPMDNLENRVQYLEKNVGEMRVSLTRIETKLENVVTWKSAFAGLAVLLIGLAGISWWVVQQILTPILQASS